MSYDKEFLEYFLSGWKLNEGETISKIEPDELEIPFDYDDFTNERLEKELDAIRELGVFWENLRLDDPKTFDKWQFDIVRNLLELELNPKGGYIQRDYSDMKFYSLMSIIVPNGVIINETETDRAWQGQGTSNELKFVQNIADVGGYSEINYQKPYLGQQYNPFTTSLRNAKYNSEFFYHRYVIVENLFWDYSEQTVDKFIDGLTSDMYYFRLGYDVKRSAWYQWYRSGGGVASPSIKVDTWSKRYFNLAMFVSEIRWCLDLIKKLNSTMVYPLFLNMAFYRTLAPKPIIENWSLIIEIIDGFIKEKGVFEL